MRKIIGTITILIVLYLGFFGSARFNIEPFILNWLKSDNGKKTTEMVVDKAKDGLTKVLN